MATTQDTLQVTSIVPNLTVDDLQKSITFYEGLGFAVDERWEDNGMLLGVMMRAGNTEIGLSQDDWKKGRDRKKGVGLRISMKTSQSVDDIGDPSVRTAKLLFPAANTAATPSLVPAERAKLARRC